MPRTENAGRDLDGSAAGWARSAVPVARSGRGRRLLVRRLAGPGAGHLDAHLHHRARAAARGPERQRRDPRRGVAGWHRASVTAERSARAGLRRGRPGPAAADRDARRGRRQRRAHRDRGPAGAWRGHKVDLRRAGAGRGSRRPAHGERRRASSTTSAGKCAPRTTNGGVRGRVADVSLIDARTTNGGVELEVSGPVASDGRVLAGERQRRGPAGAAADTQADVTARCTNGRVSVSDLAFARRRRADAAPARAARLNGGGARIDLETTNGGVPSAGPDSDAGRSHTVAALSPPRQVSVSGRAHARCL